MSASPPATRSATSARAVRSLRRRSTTASTARSAAAAACPSATRPNRVSSTAETTSQLRASTSPNPAGLRSLQDDARESDDREADRRDRQAAEQARADAARVAQDEGEGERAADGQQEQGEVEEAHRREQHLHVPRCAGAEYLRRDALRPGSRCLDVEDERAGDRVRVAGHDPPRDRVGAPREIVLEPDRDGIRGRTLNAPGVHAACVRVEDAHSAERRLDGLVEAQADARRRLVDDGVVRRVGCQELRVRRGGRHCTERHHEGGDGDEHRLPATTARVIVHVSSLCPAAALGRASR